MFACLGLFVFSVGFGLCVWIGGWAFSCLLRWFWLMCYRFRLVALSFVVGVWMYGRGLPGDSWGFFGLVIVVLLATCGIVLVGLVWLVWVGTCGVVTFVWFALFTCCGLVLWCFLLGGCVGFWDLLGSGFSLCV